MLEQLTDAERAELGAANSRYDVGCKALRIIDAHGADRAALVARVAELERDRNQLRRYGALVRESFRRVRRERDEARAERDEWRRARDTHEQNWLNEAARADGLEEWRAAAEGQRDRANELESEVTRLTEALAAAERAHAETCSTLPALLAAEARVRELEGINRGLGLEATAARVRLAAAERKAESWERGHDYVWELKVAAESQLAAANALLARIVKYACEDNARTPGATRLARALDEVNAHLSAQPAARTRAGFDCQPGSPGYCDGCAVCQPAAPTDHERAVLVECGRLKIRRDPATDELVVDQSQLMRIFLAELARREAKR